MVHAGSARNRGSARALVAGALIGALALLVGMTGWLSPAQAQQGPSFVDVDRADDPTTDGRADPGASACTGAPRDCSLRGAISAVGPSSPYSRATIGFDPSLSGGKVTLSGMELFVEKDVRIAGPGASALTVSGDNKSRVFRVGSGGDVSLSGLTVSGGKAVLGGGIHNSGTLRLEAGTRVSGNDARYGGGIYNPGTLILEGATVSGNSAGWEGGGIDNPGGSVTLRGSTVSSNRADDQVGTGGGIANGWAGSPGTLKIENSTVSGNSARYGGGIRNHLSSLTLTSSTVSGNSAGWEGGGISNTSGDAYLRFSTVTANSAPAFQGGGLSSEGRSATNKFLSSIISGNKGTDVDRSAGGYIPSMVSEGYNLVGSGNVVGVTFRKTGDQPNVADPGLSPLFNWSGSIRTHAPLPDSPAIDKGAPDAPATDQRGISRPRGAANDIGSVERYWGDPIGGGGGAGGGKDRTRPYVSLLTPTPGAKITARTPDFRAVVVDDRTDLSKRDIRVFLDGRRLKRFSYDRERDRLTVNDAGGKGPLSLGRHRLRIEARDKAGNTTKKTFDFTVVRRRGG